MEIRLFQPQSDRLAQLFHDTVREVNIQDYTADQVQAWAPENLHFRDWARVCSDLFTYIAEEAEEIIGFAELEANGHIDCFYCHKDYQRRGVGTRLYQTIETKAVELGIKKLYTEASITSRTFFKSRGFGITKEQQVLVRGEKLINYAMAKELDSPDQVVIVSFYHFTNLANYRSLRPLLKTLGDRRTTRPTTRAVNYQLRE